MFEQRFLDRIKTIYLDKTRRSQYQTHSLRVLMPGSGPPTLAAPRLCSSPEVIGKQRDLCITGQRELKNHVNGKIAVKQVSKNRYFCDVCVHQFKLSVSHEISGLL